VSRRYAYSRRCAECGYAWSIPGPKRWFAFSGGTGIELTPHEQSAARLMAYEPVQRGSESAEVREAFRHCPQCDSTQYEDIRTKVDKGSQTAP
jgi:hypothetical protein